MHPADFTAALKKRGYSILLVANDLSVSDCSVGRVVRGQGRSRRIEQRIAEITDIPLVRLWPQWYGPKAHAPLRKPRTPTRNKAEQPANAAADPEGDLTKALLGAALQASCAAAVQALIEFSAGRANVAITYDALTAAMTSLAHERAQVERHDQPQLELP